MPKVPDKLKSISANALALADEIKQISGHWLGIQIEAASPKFMIPLGFDALPLVLTDYAKQLDSWRKRFKPGRENLIRNANIGQLVRYVKNETGRFYDAAVADLIAAVSGVEDYTEGAHRNWRNRHYPHLVDPLAPYPARLSMPWK
jgi:hypothetical protein